MHSLLVDASLFTAPYDAALTRGLLAAGVRPTWATRPARPGERTGLPPERTRAFFYRRVDSASWLPDRLRAAAKAGAHIAGTLRLLGTIRRLKPDVVHVQWVVIPLIDAAAMALIRRWCPLVLTVHDTVAFNGEQMPRLQRLGGKLPVRLAHHVIVHTRAGRERLLGHGVPRERVSVIPHGPLFLPVPPAAPGKRDARWTVVLFGEIKPYKGLDVLVEAVAALSPALRDQLRVVVAGRARMDLEPIVARIDALALREHFELRAWRHSEEEMAALFAAADAFVFPYRQVDASGVYYLVRSLGKWLIASRVGVFAEEMASESGGELVPPGDGAALASALARAIARRPRAQARVAADAWPDIGRATRALYEQLLREFRP